MPGAAPGGIGLDAEQKIGAHQHALQRGANPVVEVSGRARAFVEAEQRLDVVVGGAAAISPPREVRQNLRRAGSFFGRIRGLAHEDQPAAGRILRHLAVIGTADQYRSDGDGRAGVVGLRL